MNSATHPSLDLSIVIVNWNTRQMLRECLDSVVSNIDGLHCEVIVVENASTDGSADMVEQEFPDIRLIRNTENGGFAAANNQGFAIARGRQILLLNSDTIVLGDVLARSVAYLDENPKAGAMGCRVLNTDKSVQLTCSMFPSLINLAMEASGLWKLPWPAFLGRYHMTHWHRDSIKQVEAISGCYLLIRREIVDQVGDLDESFFFFGEETDWCRRIRDVGWELHFAPVGEIIHHGGGSVKKLNHRRDIMLSEALIHLHRKHNGWLAAVAASLIIFCFHLSRVLFWTLMRLLKPSDHSRERSQYFMNILRAGGIIWPK